MEFQQLIEARKSIRGYDATKVVSKEQLEEIVKAAIQAPSWKNSQTARYHAILDPAKAEEFAQECLPEFNRKNSKGAALVVATFVANRAGFSTDGTPDNECGNGWGYYDLGLHSQNFVLKAKEIGLDTLIMGIRDAEKIREKLNIPAEETIVSVIALGYAAAEPRAPKRKEVEEILTIY